MPIQSTDTTTTITVTSAAEMWVVKTGVVVAPPQHAFVSEFDRTSLLNYGHISGSDRAVLMMGGNGYLANHWSGVLESQNVAVQMNGAWSRIANDGMIRAGEIGVGAGGERAYVDNTGVIAARLAVTLDFTELAVLQNTGEIRSTERGVLISGAKDLVATVDNSGLISGPVAAIDCFQQAGLVLRNSGTIDGKVTLAGSATSSSVVNTGTMRGDVVLGLAADLFDGRGGALLGGVHGGGGADRLIGGADDDTITGGLGRDRMDGGKGPGEDVFVFADVKDSRPASPDLIYKHFGLEDLIDLSAMDANRSAAGFQALSFAGLVAPADPLPVGKVGYYKQGGDTFVVFDTTGDGAADFKLQIDGTFNLTAGEFVL